MSGSAHTWLGAIILVCSLVTTPDAQRLQPPRTRTLRCRPGRFRVPAQCSLQGQPYLAGLAIGPIARARRGALGSSAEALSVAQQISFLQVALAMSITANASRILYY